MEGHEAVFELTALAARAGIDVRIEPFGLPQLAGKGGLCRIRGRLAVLVDEALGSHEQAVVIGRALATVDLGSILIPLALAPYLRFGSPRPRPMARAGARPKASRPRHLRCV